MNREKYIASIIKKLNCKKKQKKQIKHELESDILSAEESGESWEEIIARMGTPDEVASEFNANITDSHMSFRKKIIYTALITATSIIVLIIAGRLILNYKYGVQEIDNVEMKATYETAEKVISLVSNDEIDTLYDEYAAESFKGALDKEELIEKVVAAKDSLNKDWGDFQKITSHYERTVKQNGKYYSNYEIVALYENLSVTYTLAFEQEGKMTALYMK